MKKLIWTAPTAIDLTRYPVRNSFRHVSNAWEFPIDRFSIADGLLELDCANIVREPIFDLSNINHSWKDRYFDVVDSLVDDIFKNANDRTVYLSYSGGIDSLVVLAAVQRNPQYNEYIESERFKLALNSSSIDENQEFFFRNILPSIPITVVDFNSLMLDDDAYIVTGEYGDHVISSSDVLSLLKFDENFDLMSNWNEILHLLKSRPAENFEKYIELCMIAKKNQPFEIESSNQLVWWVNQCYASQHELTQPYFWSKQTDLSGLDNDSKVFRFFYNPKFVTYSYEYMSTNPVYNTYKSARQFPKEYIFNHFNNESIMSKGKVYSQRLISRIVYKTQIWKTDTGYQSVFNSDRI